MGRQKSVLVAVAALALAALVSAQPETEIAAKAPSGAEFLVGKIKLAPALAPALAAKLGGHAGRKLEQAKPAAKKAPAPAPPSLAQGGKAPAPAPAAAKKPASKPPAKKPASKPAGAKPAATQPTVPSAQGGERRRALLAAHLLPARALLQDDKPQASLTEKTKGEAAAAPAPAKAHGGKKKTAPAAAAGEDEEKEGDRRRALLQQGQMLAESPTASLSSPAGGERRRRLAQAMETGAGGGAAAPFPAVGAPAPLTHAAPAPAGPEFATFKPAASPAAAPLAQQQGVAAGAPAAAPGAEVSNSVYDAIAANPQYSVLKSLVDKAGLAGALGPQFSGTAFVPSNAAFDAYAKSSGTSVQAIEGKNPADIKKLVAFHVIKSKIDPATVKSKETQETLLTGAKIDLLPPAAAGGGATEAAATALPLPAAVPSSMPSSKPVPLAPVVYRAGNALIVPTDGVLTPSAKDLQATI